MLKLTNRELKLLNLFGTLSIPMMIFEFLEGRPPTRQNLIIAFDLIKLCYSNSWISLKKKSSKYVLFIMKKKKILHWLKLMHKIHQQKKWENINA